MLGQSAIRHLVVPATMAAAFAVAVAVPGDNHATAQINDNWVTIVMPAEPPDLEGCQSSRAFQGRVVKQNIVETLIEKNAEDGTLKPRLATSWDRIDDRNWQFHLRQGVTYHDGTPFNAETLKRALDRTLHGTGVVCGDNNKFFSGIMAEVTVVDDDTIQISTDVPAPILPMRMAATAITGPDEPMDQPSLAPNGTGPYKFQEWNQGTEILLSRNEDYWGDQPEVEGARYIWRDESAVRASMVELGEADVGIVIAQQDANNPELDYSYLNSETTFLRLDATKEPLSDVRVRQAINHALDVEGLIGTLMPESALRATQIVMPSIPGHNHELDKRAFSYDPEKAKALLEEAKADGVDLSPEILYIAYPPHYPNALETQEAFFTMLQNIGLNVKLTTVEPGQYAEWNNKPHPSPRPPTILQSSHDNNFGDPVFSVAFKFGCDGNTSLYCNPIFDQMVAHASTLGGQERIDAWKEIFRTQYEDLVTSVFMYHMVGFTRVNPRIDYIPDVTSNAELRIQEWSFQ